MRADCRGCGKPLKFVGEHRYFDHTEEVFACDTEGCEWSDVMIRGRPVVVIGDDATPDTQQYEHVEACVHGFRRAGASPCIKCDAWVDAAIRDARRRLES